MKRPAKLALWISSVFVLIASGLTASIAWFEMNRYQVDVGVSGSVVEDYFHCGHGTANDPFVITRPIHYYHLVEFFQRETVLPIGNEQNVNFGSDYLYFQVGYDLDNDGDYEVYSYDNLGIYHGTDQSPSYSTSLNMAYYSGDNALLPIGTNEVPFVGNFNGRASDGISISNLNIHCAETVKDSQGNTINRAASDIGIFGYVADQDSQSNKTIIQNVKFNGLNIDLSDVTSTVASSSTTISHVDTHAGVAYVGYVVGHVHSYTNYSSTGPTNASPLLNVYVTNVSISGGAGVHCDYGYIGKVDTNDGGAATSVVGEVSTVISGGGQGDNFGEGGSINVNDYQQWLYNGPRDSGAALQEGSNSVENHITKSNQYEAHYTVSSTTNFNKDFLFLARNSDSKAFYFHDGRGVFYNGSNHPFSWKTHNNGVKPSGMTNYTITFDQALDIGGTTSSVFYLNHINTSSSRLKVYTDINGSGTDNQAESSGYDYISNIVYRLKDNSNGTSGNTHKTYIPLKFSDSERSAVSDNNTGYIVGTSLVASSGGASANGSPKIGSYGSNFVSNSLGATAYSASDIVKKGAGNSTFNDSQVEILTYSTNDSDWVAIKDTHNASYYGNSSTPKNASISDSVSLLRTPEQLGLKKYEVYASDPSIVETAEMPLTRNVLRNIMTYKEGEVDKSYYHISGIHFDTVTANGTKYGVVANSSNYKVTIPMAHLNGVPSANSASYELLTGAINFFFPSKGFVNFFAGTYNSDPSVFCNFFSLYNVKRNPSRPNQISSIHEIVGVYKKKNAAANDPYIYKVYNVDSDGDAIGDPYFLDTSLTTNDLELVYDVDKSLRCGTAHKAPVNNALYYFEIPINPGEYAMGAVSNSTNAGAYMIYLDIGANSDLTQNQISGIKDVPLFTQIDFQTDTFVINSCFNVAYIIPSGATKGNFSVAISCRTVTHEGNEYKCYELVIDNVTGTDFLIHCLLMDNDNDPNNDYFVMYAITYNGGARNEYLASNSYTGESGEQTMAPTFTPS